MNYQDFLLMQDPQIQAMLRANRPTGVVPEPPADILLSREVPNSPFAPNIPPPNPPTPDEMGAPGGNTVMMGGAGPMPAGIPDKPGFWERLKATLPRMMEAGIAGAATPNVAGGGAVDIFRAMQSGRDALDKRDMMAYGMGRQQDQDALNSAKAQADIRQSDAAARAHDSQAKYYEAQAGAKGEVSPQAALFRVWQQNRTTENWNRYLQSIGHEPKQQFPYRPIGGGRAIDAQGNIIETDPDAAKAARLKEIRTMMGGSYLEPTIWPDNMLPNAMNPQQRQYWLTGKMPNETAERNPTEVSVAVRAAQGDPEAKKTLALLQGPRNASMAQADALARMQAGLGFSMHYTTMLNQAENDFQREQDRIQSTMRPGSVVNGMPIPDTPQQWDTYKSALHDAQVRLMTKKKNIDNWYQASQGALQSGKQPPPAPDATLQPPMEKSPVQPSTPRAKALLDRIGRPAGDPTLFNRPRGGSWMSGPMTIGGM